MPRSPAAPSLMSTSPSPRKSRPSTARPQCCPPTPSGPRWPGCAASTTACSATATAPGRPNWTARSSRSARPAPSSRPASNSGPPCKPSTTTPSPSTKTTAGSCSPRCSPRSTRTPHEPLPAAPGPPRPAARTRHRQRQPRRPHRGDRRPRPPAHRLLARRLRRPPARAGQPHRPSPATAAPGRPRRPRPRTHLEPDRRAPRHHRRHCRPPLPEPAMINLTKITCIMPMSERRISLAATARNLNRLRSLLAGLDLDAASTLHAVGMSIDIQMTTEQVRGPAIHVHALEKSYKKLRALRGVDFDAARGSIFALLGSNGAGKTTVVNILSTLLKPDAGTATVAGFDIATQPADVRESISLTGQFAAVDEILTGRENLILMARLRRVKDAGQIADALLARFQLVDAAKRRVATYSGGMRRRLDIAMSLIGNPPVIFLDEPTTGLDPQGRIEVWNSVKELAGQGTTVLLTTQYLDEAEQLADRIAILHRGQIIANGTLAELKQLLPPAKVEYVEKQPTLEDVFLAIVGATGQDADAGDRSVGTNK